jgi:hypothetical protein
VKSSVFDAAAPEKEQAGEKGLSRGRIGTIASEREVSADLDIPKGRKREGRKMSPAAARLAVSPKKVRRSLSGVGVADATINS